jgi:hypothetical protein
VANVIGRLLSTRLSVAVEGLAAELGVRTLPSSDVPKLVGGVALLVAMGRWTTPKSAKSARGRSGRRRR